MKTLESEISGPATALTGEALNFVLYLLGEIRHSRRCAAAKAVAGL